MKQRVKLLIFSVAIFAFLGTASCNPLNKISVVGGEMPGLNGLSSLRGAVTVTSDNPRDMVVESALLTLHYRDRELVGAHLAAPVVVPARQTARVNYEFAFDKFSFSAITALPQAITSPELVTLDIDAVVSYGGTRKKVRLEKVPLSEIIRNFAPR
jgi:hypothetical protein